MSVPQYLVDPERKRVVAMLIPGESVQIYDQRLVESITASGIAIPGSQKKSFGGRVYIYPNDADKALFARAFAEIQVPRGLAQGGMRWQATPEIETTEQLAKRIISLYQTKGKIP
jgi:hypothetical protein